MIQDIIIYTPMYVTFFWSIILLLSHRNNNMAKQYLGIFMLTAFLLYLTHAVYFNEQRSTYLYFEPLYTFVCLLVYPLYYIYIKVLCRDISFKIKNLLLFLPALLFTSASIIIYLFMNPEERMIYINDFFYHNKTEVLTTTLQKIQGMLYVLSRITFAIQVVYFLILGSRLVLKYNERVANFYSNLESKTLTWVNTLLISFVFTSFASLALNIIGKYYFVEAPFLLLIPSLIFSFLFFSIGLQGYSQNYSATDLIYEEKVSSETPLKCSNNDHLKERLIKVFEEDNIYRNPDLRIVDVSILLHTNRTYVSKMINSDFKCSFSDFVNQYRVNEAKELLKDQSADKYTIEYVSETVGFGSVHSFIRVFKDSEGITPGNFRAKK